MIRPGDLFYTSWGYDQTNIDFVVVVESKTGKTVCCKMGKADIMGASGTQDLLRPTGETYGESFRLRVTDYGLKGSYPYCNGGTRFGYFYPWEREAIGQTMTQFGH